MNSLKFFSLLKRIQVHSTFLGLAIDIHKPLDLLRGSYLEKLFWHVANTIDSLNASIPSDR